MTGSTLNRLRARVLFAALALAGPASAGSVDPDLEARLRDITADTEIPVIISLYGKASVNGIVDTDKRARRRKIANRLRDHALSRQQTLLNDLARHGATHINPLWISNSIAATVPAALVRTLSRKRGVARVQADAIVGTQQGGGTLADPDGVLAAALSAPEWNIQAIHAPEVWQLGYAGQGAVVASMDSGVDAAHPDLSSRYRGGTHGWFDTHGQHASPIDTAGALTGHGTHTVGLMVGGDAGGSAIGVAPDAQWIAVKVFDNQGKASLSHFVAGLQWLLGLAGDAPDVVNGSFQITGSFNSCETTLEASVQALKAAGIAVVFAAGNSGPTPASSVSPANNPSGFSVGSVAESNAIASSSSRGPSACDNGLYPKLVAPGENVATTDISLGGIASYATVSGTSFAAPQVAGALALLGQAFPTASVSDLEAALTESATDLGTPGPDNTYGYGLLDVAGAYDRLANAQLYPSATVDDYEIDEDHTLTVIAPGVLENDHSPTDPPLALTAVLVGQAAHGNVTLNADGSFSYQPSSNFNGVDGFSYRADDGGHTSGMTLVTIQVNAVNDPPVAQPDTVTRANIGAGTVIAVLNNDSDPDSAMTPVIDSPPAHGNATVNANGTVTYVNSGTSATTDSFTYHVTDGDLTSASVLVTLTVSNQAPEISSTPEATASAGAPYVYQIAATDPNLTDIPPDTLTYAGVTAPPGVSVHPVTGMLNWTPTPGQAGARAITVKVTDSGGLTDTQNFTVTVNGGANSAPTASNDLFLFRPGIERTVSTRGSGGLGVLANDADPDNDALSALLVRGDFVLPLDGSFTYLAKTARAVSFRYRTTDGSAYSEPARGTSVRLVPDTSPMTGGDDCTYFAGIHAVSHPERCAIGPNVIDMNLALNDSDPNQHRHIPSDGMGMTVVPGSLALVGAGAGVVIIENRDCGQDAMGVWPAARATIENRCDGHINVAITPGNDKQPVLFSYRISDDLGAASRPRRVKLSLKP